MALGEMKGGQPWQGKSPPSVAPVSSQVTVTSIDIPFDEVFWLVLKFTFATIAIWGIIGFALGMIWYVVGQT